MGEFCGEMPECPFDIQELLRLIEELEKLFQ